MLLDEHKDLSFYPIRNASPAILSNDQIDHYNREGFLTSLPAFTGDAIERNRQYFDQLLEQLGGKNGYAINCYQARCEGIWDLCTSPVILDYVQDMIGPNIICWASHFFCKLPHDTKAVPWHQDAVYWHLTPARTVTVWLAIDDADEDNSAMEFIPRSHNQGVLEWRKPEGDNVPVLDREVVNATTLGTPLSNNLQAGQISLHADMLAHGSKPNASGRRRCGLTIRYCSPVVGFADPRWAQGLEAIQCRGVDTSGHWKHHERPFGNDVSPENAPGNFGGN